MFLSAQYGPPSQSWTPLPGFSFSGSFEAVTMAFTSPFLPGQSAPAFQRMWRFLPGAMPSILVGLRFSLGLVWVLLIVAETISAQSGIGYMTMNAREFLQTDVVLVGILLYALLGKLADVLAVALERFLLRWHAGYQK